MCGGLPSSLINFGGGPGGPWLVLASINLSMSIWKFLLFGSGLDCLISGVGVLDFIGPIDLVALEIGVLVKGEIPMLKLLVTGFLWVTMLIGEGMFT